MFTDTIYSNRIGTVVREITSNCFDSHIEAGVNTPVVIRKTHDTTDDTHYVSFIDFGVGMSPDRVENIYGVYFESTKRDNNDEIGGFGIGGKTPLAYKRSTGHGEGEYDNSFFVITNFDGTKYVYNVFEGEDSPEFALLHSEKTKERNGTEIRVPILQSDIRSFESEIKKQLYYFENLIFEGFSEDVSNEYQIIRGKSFLYRGDAVSDYMHVCLGKVAYPIDYGNLGLSQRDHQIPVAINVPIGDIGVVASREELNYSQETIKYLKAKLEEVKDELKEMLAKQYDNVQTLEDYFKVKNHFGTLYLSDTKSLKIDGMIKPSDIDYSNYAFSFMKTPNDRQLLDLLFNVKVYGAKEKKNPNSWRYRNKGTNYHQMSQSYEGLQEATNAYYVEDYETPLKRIKQSYLRNQHGRFYILSPVTDFQFLHRKINEMFNMEYDPTTKDGIAFTTTLFSMQSQYMDIIRKHTEDYAGVEVPEDYIEESKRPKLSEEVKNATIPVKILGGYSKSRIKLIDLMEFNGVIYYGTQDDASRLRDAKSIYEALYGEEHVGESYSTYYDEKFGSKKGIIFIIVAKNNLKYAEYFKKPKQVGEFYFDLVHRKQDAIINFFKNSDLTRRFNDLDNLYKNKRFTEISPEWAEVIGKMKMFVDAIDASGANKIHYIQNYKYWLENHFEIDAVEQTKEEIAIREDFDLIDELRKQNKDVLNYVNTPYYDTDTISDTQIEIFKKVMSF